MLFFYSVTIEYDNGQGHAAAVRLREGFIKPSQSGFYTFTLFLWCSWSINWSHPWGSMLLLTGRLKLLNVLRITANQLINYGFFQVSLNFSASSIEIDWSSILSDMFSDFNNTGKWFYIIFCHIFCFSSPKATPIYHLKAHLNQKSSSSWRTLLKVS